MLGLVARLDHHPMLRGHGFADAESRGSAASRSSSAITSGGPSTSSMAPNAASLPASEHGGAPVDLDLDAPVGHGRPDADATAERAAAVPHDLWTHERPSVHRRVEFFSCARDQLPGLGEVEAIGRPLASVETLGSATSSPRTNRTLTRNEMTCGGGDGKRAG